MTKKQKHYVFMEEARNKHLLGEIDQAYKLLQLANSLYKTKKISWEEFMDKFNK